MIRTVLRGWLLLPLGLAAVSLAGCGQSSPRGNAVVPLISGARVVYGIERCDQGSNPFCSRDLVVADDGAGSSGALLTEERQHLRRLGWSLQSGEIGQERSAVSPGNKTRVVFATAAGDLLALDLGWIARPPPVGPALSRTLFAGEPAISLMVEAGPA
jgi:hypothetical protein